MHRGLLRVRVDVRLVAHVHLHAGLTRLRVRSGRDSGELALAVLVLLWLLVVHVMVIHVMHADVLIVDFGLWLAVDRR